MWEETDEQCELCGQPIEFRREDGQVVAERCSAGCYEGKTLDRFRSTVRPAVGEFSYFIYDRNEGLVSDGYPNAVEALRAAKERGIEDGMIGLDLKENKLIPHRCPTVMQNFGEGWGPVSLEDATNLCELIHEIHRVLQVNTCGYDEGTLIALAYLYPAIVADEQIDAFDETGDLYDEFVDLVKALFPPEHGIWKFIRLNP